MSRNTPQQLVQTFKKQFTDEFGDAPDPRQVALTIQGVLDEKQSTWVYDRLKGINYKNLTDMLEAQKVEWKEVGLKMARDEIARKGFGQAENILNKMHSEQILSNDEYRDLFNKELDPAKKLHAEEYNMARALDSVPALNPESIAQHALLGVSETLPPTTTKAKRTKKKK